MDLTKLSVTDLRKLNRRVQAEIKKRDAGARRDLLKKMQRLAADHGMSLEDVVGNAPAAKPARKAAAKPARPSRAKGTTVPPKYRNPEDATMTWTGRGRKPLWVQKALDDGKTLEELAIKND